MALAVCLLFDGRSERRLLAMWQALDSRGVPTLLTHTHRRHVPHLSLVVLRRYDVEEVRRALAALPASAPCEVHFDAVARFRRGRVALVGAVSAELMSRQARAVAAAEGVGAEVHAYYRRVAGFRTPASPPAPGVHRRATWWRPTTCSR